MNAKRYHDLDQVSLGQYLPAKDFRTVSISQIHLPHGRTEIPVEIEVTASFAARLSVRPPWDGVFSGYIRENDSIRGMFGEAVPGMPAKRKISLIDWEDHFLMVFDQGVRELEKVFSVRPDDVCDLLENCLHAKPL